MIDFLKNSGISKNTINDLTTKYNEQIIFDLSCNEQECKRIIYYFKSLGIANVDNILVNRIDIFLNRLIDVVNPFKKYNIPIVVGLINADYSYIDNIL